MLTRCRNPNREDWRLYGGRGIKVCDRWLKFKQFLEDMGERPAGTTLDRINSNGNYEQGNCRWATPLEQVRGRRKGHFKGEKNHQARLSWAQVREIRAAWKALNAVDTTRRKQMLMEKYGVSSGCITKIVYNQTWQED